MSTKLDFQPRLAVDCSSEFLSVAVQANNKIWANHQKVINRHSNFIIPMIAECLKTANIELSELQLIAYTNGPGSFTGLRIALAVIKGLALPYHIPLVAVPTLDLVAFQAKNTTATKIIAGMDARMHEIFLASFQASPFKRLSADSILKNEDLAQLYALDSNHTLLVGNAFSANSPSPNNILVQMPQADLMFELVDAMKYEHTSAEKAELSYVRNKVALTLKEQQNAKRP